MNRDRWAELAALLESLGAETPAERTPSLEALRLRDPALHAELRSLLAAHDAFGPVDEIARVLGSGDASGAPPGALEGRRIDRYELERLVGRGGMGEVYRARDTRLERDVALKFLPHWLGHDPAARGRVMTEARTVSSLDHPNICTLFEVGETTDGQLFLVMPYYEGETLRARLRRGPLPRDRIRDVLVQLSHGLAAAHDRGVIHRDIKPANILLTRDGLVKILDFGVAALIGEDGAPGAARAGTLPYMAPEQRSGNPVDARTDLWALGIVLHEMATGRRPENGAISPDARRRLPAPLIAVLERLLQASPNDRPASAREVVALATRDRGLRPAHLGAGIAAVAAGSLMLIPLLGSAADGGLRGFGRAIRMSSDAGIMAQPAIAPDGRRLAFAAGNQGHTRIAVRTLDGTAVTTLTATDEGAESSPTWHPDGSRVLFLRDSAAFSVPADGGEARLEVAVRGIHEVTSAAWSPDGRLLAFTAGDSLIIRDSAGHDRFVAPAVAANSCRWSPDGRHIACAVGNHWYAQIGALFGNLSPSAISVYSVTSGEARRLTDSVSLNQAPAWTADGSDLVYISNRHGPLDLYQVPVSGGAPRRLTTGLGAQWFALGPGDRELVYSVLDDRGNIWSVPLAGGVARMDLAEQVTHAATSIETFDVSDDRRWLVYSADIAGNGDLFRQSLESGEIVRLTTDPAGDYSPDILSGRPGLVAFQSWRAGTRDLYLMTIDGDSLQPVFVSPRQEVMPRWSPDGQSLAFSHFEDDAAEITVIERSRGGGWSTPEVLARGHMPAWSPDGDRIAFLTDMPRGTLRETASDRPSPRDVLPEGSPLRVSGEFVEYAADGGMRLLARDANGVAAIWEISAGEPAPRRLIRFDQPGRPVLRPYFAVRGELLFVIVQEQRSALWTMDVQHE
jgi:Tol biopolymer transport system component